MLSITLAIQNATYKDTRKLIQQPVLRGCNNKEIKEGKSELHDAKLKFKSTRENYKGSGSPSTRLEASAMKYSIQNPL
jgi:hypothetical protein